MVDACVRYKRPPESLYINVGFPIGSAVFFCANHAVIVMNDSYDELAAFAIGNLPRSINGVPINPLHKKGVEVQGKTSNCISIFRCVSSPITEKKQC